MNYWRSITDLFSTSSAQYLLSVASLFSTTSADYWQGQRNFFSTTSATYFLAQNQGASFSTTSAIYFADASTSIPKTYAPNNFTALQTFTNASTTNLSSDYASSTFGFFGSLSIGSLTGFLKATAGAITSALIDLASDVTGILPVGNGGTGWASLASGAIPYGNGSSAIATTSAGTSGQVLALLNGVPTWTATTTLSTISGTLAAGSGGTGIANPSAAGFLIGSYTGGSWQQLATSSLNISTDNLAEGASNLFWTNARFDNRLSATTSLPNIITLANLANVGALTATSLNVLSASQFGNSVNFFGLTSFGATGTTTIATDGTISTPSIIATTATSSTFFAGNSSLRTVPPSAALPVRPSCRTAPSPSATPSPSRTSHPHAILIHATISSRQPLHWPHVDHHHPRHCHVDFRRGSADDVSQCHGNERDLHLRARRRSCRWLLFHQRHLRRQQLRRKRRRPTPRRLRDLDTRLKRQRQFQRRIGLVTELLRRSAHAPEQHELHRRRGLGWRWRRCRRLYWGRW